MRRESSQSVANYAEEITETGLPKENPGDPHGLCLRPRGVVPPDPAPRGSSASADGKAAPRDCHDARTRRIRPYRGSLAGSRPLGEVDAYKGGAAIELDVDPASGRVLAQHPDSSDPRPPANAKALSQILTDVEAAGYTQITEATFKSQAWEIETVRSGAKRELRIDVVTGKVLSDRADD